ncbi:MAG TPA: transcriptional repressor [Acidobacteriota bacterium]|nr:transcriptional repressor [Acidobacteriota bacterium]
MGDPINEQLEVFAEYVRAKGLRKTRQRDLVVRTFLRTEGHLSTDELYNLVRKEDSKIGYATVFRTLKTLTDCGLARETDLGDGFTRFEHLYKHPHHHHILCVECNRTIEFYSPELEELQKKIVSEYDFEPVRYKFQVYGVCRECRAKIKPTQENVVSDLVFARDALKIAMETERRGVRFYKTASKVAARPLTRTTFLRMLKDEEKHLKNLKSEWNRLIAHNEEVLNAPVFLHFDFDALKKIFPSREEISRRLSSDLNEGEALRLALAMEKDAFAFFSNYAERFSDTHGRDIFLKFAAEEQEHCETIEAALSSLSD